MTEAPPLVAGALLGTAAGDVLGAGYEGLPPEAVRAVGEGPLMPRGRLLYTDDTQQALVLAYHLLEHGQVVPGRLAEDFLALARPVARMGAYRGTGPGFRSFVAALDRGAPGEAPQPSAGNGAAMRIAPVAIRYGGDRDRLIEEATRASLVTHADPRGVGAAVAQTVAIAEAAAGREGRELVQEAAEAAAEAEHRLFEAGRLGPSDHWHTFSRALRAAVASIGRAPEEVAASVGERAAASSATGRSWGTDPYAPASVVTSIVVGAGGVADGPEAVRAAVALGGDADTVGAMVGAIVGSARGVADWPWGIPNLPLFVELGVRLAERDRGTGGLPELYELEAGLGGPPA